MRKDKDQECMICIEEYGTRSPEGETVERQIRLPCNSEHTVGSSCIFTWLQAHNTCPICRYEFFPAQRTDKARTTELYISFQDEEDLTDGGEDTDDEDFIDECGETDEEDVNMSDEDEGMTDAGCQQDDYDEKDDDDDDDDDV